MVLCVDLIACCFSDAGYRVSRGAPQARSARKHKCYSMMLSVILGPSKYINKLMMCSHYEPVSRGHCCG